MHVATPTERHCLAVSAATAATSFRLSPSAAAAPAIYIIVVNNQKISVPSQQIDDTKKYSYAWLYFIKFNYISHMKRVPA